MLTHLGLKEFKGFIHAELPFSRLTFLVGANAAGKSNVFDAIRFFQGIGLGLSLSEIFSGRWEGGQQTWAPLRGGSAEAARGTGGRFGCLSDWSRAGQSLLHRVEVGIDPEPHVRLELAAFSSKKNWLVDSIADSLGSGWGVRDGGVIRVALSRSGKGKSLARDFSNHRSVLGQITPIASLNKEVLECQEALLDCFKACRFLDLSPPQMRGYVPRQVRELGLHGQNLSGILWQLCKDKDQKERILDWLTELCAPELTDLDFVHTDIGDVMLKVKEGASWVSARSLSDGTLRFLGLLVALETAPEGSTILIEEVENGLHPTRISLLVEMLTNYTKHRDVQVIATTHSPYLLAQLPREVLDSVLLFARMPEDSRCEVRRLGDLPNFSEVMEKEGFERLFTTAWLERAL